MKTIWIVCAVLILAFGIGYQWNGVQDRDEFLEKLAIDVKEAPYEISDGRLDVFDCSNMSHLLRDYLYEKGYEAMIVLLTKYPVGHAYVIVYNRKREKTYIVESTLKKVYPKIPSFYWDKGAIIGDAEELLRFIPLKDWEEEWDYRNYIRKG